MPQETLDIISVNLWQMAASLLNLLLLFLVVKKFLYKPIKKMLDERQNTIEGNYEAAEKAKEEALNEKLAYEEKIKDAKEEAAGIIKSAAEKAELRGEKIVAEAKEKADGIIRRAENDAELELKKAEDRIKQEIVDVSTLLAEKMLEREVKADDHKAMIDSFIDSIGEEK